MNKAKKEKRSWTVTIVAGLFAAVVLFFLLIAWPPHNLADVLFLFCVAILLLFSVYVAIMGRKGMLKQLFSIVIGMTW